MTAGLSMGDDYLGPEAFAHLTVPQSGTCWWCEQRQATTGEHKFKRTDLARLMGDRTLIYGSDQAGIVKEIRGKSGITRDRYGVIKFPKSMCELCNNNRSQPLDQAYEAFSNYAASNWLRIMAGVDFTEIFGPSWQEPTLNVARYYGKHFGCEWFELACPFRSHCATSWTGAPICLIRTWASSTRTRFTGSTVRDCI